MNGDPVVVLTSSNAALSIPLASRIPAVGTSNWALLVLHIVRSQGWVFIG